MAAIEAGHPLEKEFTHLNLIFGPVRRALVNGCIGSAMVGLSGFNLVVFFATLIVLTDHFLFGTDSAIKEYFNIQSITQVTQIGLGLIPLVTLVYDSVFFAIYLSNISM